MPPPMPVLRPPADGSAVRTCLSCRQLACLQPRAAARLALVQTDGQTDGRISVSLNTPVKGKVFPYSLPSVGPGADPGVQAVSPQVT